MTALVPGRPDEGVPFLGEDDALPHDPRPSIIGAGFFLAAVGALLICVGAIQIWLTVGIPNESSHTGIPGIDLPDGRVALVCALIILVLLMASGSVRARHARELACLACLAMGIVAAAIGAIFLLGGSGRSVVIRAVGIPKEMWETFGVFRDVGPGVYMVLGGDSLRSWALR
jgi:hypothetical protein